MVNVSVNRLQDVGYCRPNNSWSFLCWEQCVIDSLSCLAFLLKGKVVEVIEAISWCWCSRYIQGGSREPERFVGGRIAVEQLS